MKGTLFSEDPYLAPYKQLITERYNRHKQQLKDLAPRGDNLSEYAQSYTYYGLHREDDRWVFREWLPQATEVFFLCDKTDWSCKKEGQLKRIGQSSDWEISFFPTFLQEGDHFKLHVRWEGGEGDRIPAYAFRTHQDRDTHKFTAKVWIPGQFPWKYDTIKSQRPLIIYEAHVGMAMEEQKVGTFKEFKESILPRVIRGGYNTLQLMALMEHPYYGSFGYQVSSFYSVSSRFGSPDDLKELIDECHKQGIAVIMDLVHSHAVKNTEEGIAYQDGSDFAYFHGGDKGNHPAWDSRCFDYSKDKVIQFLLSNCAWWLNEYKVDGFRFDGVTSMIYHNHGLGDSFNHYDMYFNDNVDKDCLTYLSVANELIHSINPHAITIAEDMSGMPGMARSQSMGGMGFDYRLAMGLPDYWGRLLKLGEEHTWNVDEVWGTLNNRRFTEKSIAYSESHDQALVGDKTIAFRLMDSHMYDHMLRGDNDPVVSKGLALHKIIRLLTFSLGGDGYMNFMGNEFGHPEWIDFPRDGNNWSHYYARRQWSLADNKDLKYSQLGEFDKAMVTLCTPCLKFTYAHKVISHVSDQVLAYTRGSLLFVINLHGERSYTEYGFFPNKGVYKLILSSDSHLYGGYDRIQNDLVYDKRKRSKEGELSLYLPSLSAQVYVNEEISEI